MKNSIIIILILSCIALWVFRKKEPIVIEKEVRVLVDSEVKRVNNKIDKEGFQHAVISEVENTVNSRAQIGGEVKKELDSVTQLLGIKTKQLNHYIRYAVSLEDSLLVARKGKDSVFRYVDRWADISFVPTNKGGHFNFKYNAEVNYTEYYKRDWFLGRKRNYIDFWVNDPRASIGGVRRIKIEPKQDKIRFNVGGIAIYHNGLHSGFDGELSIGNRYRFRAGYLYDFNSESWKPIFSGRMSLIDF